MHARGKLSIVPLDHSPCGCSLCPTRRLCAAADLEEDVLPLLAACMRTSLPMAKGDHLYREGDPAESCFVVRSGVYKTSTVSSSGHEYITGFYFSGELIGFNGQRDGRYLDTAIALETSTVCRLLIRDLPKLWSIGGGPPLLRMLAERQDCATRQQINLCQSRADARVARFLLESSKRMQRLGRDSALIPTPMSRTDLANYLGITLECLSRILARFRNAGLIRAERTEIQILVLANLESLAFHTS